MAFSIKRGIMKKKKREVLWWQQKAGEQNRMIQESVTYC